MKKRSATNAELYEKLFDNKADALHFAKTLRVRASPGYFTNTGMDHTP